MRLLVVTLLMIAISFGLLNELFPLAITSDGRVFSRADAELLALLLAGYMLAESILGIVTRRKLLFVQKTFEKSEQENKEVLQDLKSKEAEIQFERALVTKADKSVESLELKINALDQRHAEQLEEMRVALKNAQLQKDTYEKQVGEKGRDVLHFLSRLQEKGRFVDFIMEEVGGFSDQQVGSAARYVHDGCRAVVKEYLELSHVQEGEEGKAVTITVAKDPLSLRFIGRSASNFPVTGTLVHRGWKATRVSLPQLSASSDADSIPVIAPAEIELR